MCQEIMSDFKFTLNNSYTTLQNNSSSRSKAQPKTNALTSMLSRPGQSGFVLGSTNAV